MMDQENILKQLLKYPYMYNEKKLAEILGLDLEEAKYILDLAKNLSVEFVELVSFEKLKCAFLTIKFLHNPSAELLKKLLKKEEARKIICETLALFCHRAKNLDKVVDAIRMLMRSRDVDLKWYCSVLLNIIYAKTSDREIREKIKRVRSTSPLIRELLNVWQAQDRIKEIRKLVKKYLLDFREVYD